MTEYQPDCLDLPNNGNFWKKYLTCNACNKPLYPPVYCCQNSNIAHPLCNHCVQCNLPECSAKIGSTRGVLLEKILSVVKFSCEYQCNIEPLIFTDYRNHTQNCYFRPLPCKLCNESVDFRGYLNHLISKHRIREKYKEPSNDFYFDFAEGQPEIQCTKMENKLFLFRYENNKFWIEVLAEEEDAHLDYCAHVAGIKYEIDQKLKIFDARSGLETFYNPRSSVFGLVPCAIPAEDEQLCVEIFLEEDDNSISSLEYFDADGQNQSDLAVYAHKLADNVKDLLPQKQSSMAIVDTSDTIKIKQTPAITDNIDSDESDSGSNCAISDVPSHLSGSEAVHDSNEFQIKRNHVLQELVCTENAYVLATGEVISGYGERQASEDPTMQSLLPTQLQKHSFQFANNDGTIIREFTYNRFLFSNLEQIHEFHAKTFLPKLIESNESTEMIGHCFTDSYDDFFTLYNQYCQELPSITFLRKEIGENHQWMEYCRRKLKHRLALNSYLLQPVQRITKYQLLLKDLIKYSEGIKGYSTLLNALDRMLNILRLVDDGMLQQNIVDYPRQIQDEGQLLLQAPFAVLTENDRYRNAGHPRHLFLYQNCILICKKDKDSPNNSLHYKSKINLNEIGLTEALNIHGPATRFELWTPGRVKVWLLQAETIPCKELWVVNIKRILMEQLETARNSGTPKEPALNVIAAI